MSEAYQYLFGPVPSRRLGRSLGVDLIPFKRCTQDCVYCQLGETPCTVSARAEYVPMEAVLGELERWKASGGQADHITLAGSGEPTLHVHFGDVFNWVRDNFSTEARRLGAAPLCDAVSSGEAGGKTHCPSAIQSVLLTNGSLLYLPEVRAAAALADKVKVTLSAWDETSFQQIHRPAQTITFERLVEGERAFREMYSGELSVEVFIVDGMNSQIEQCRKIAEIVRSIQPDRIDINTAVRPPAVSGVQPSSPEHLHQLAALFGDKAAVTASFKQASAAADAVSEEMLLGLIRRHPAGAEQLAQEFGVSLEKLKQTLEQMVSAGQLLVEERGGETYYFCRG
ncbi:MAG: radical SAM protein [Pontiellaceae bacterium]|nr:radical SAM protein [Pontiellaceae bacterium]